VTGTYDFIYNFISNTYNGLTQRKRTTAHGGISDNGQQQNQNTQQMLYKV